MPAGRRPGKRRSREYERAEDTCFQLTTEDAVSAPPIRIKQNGPSWLEERLGEANRNAKIGTAKTFDDRERHTNHFSIVIDERSARATGSGLRIVDNFVRKHVADVSLSHQGTDEFTAEKLIDNLFWVFSRGLC